MLKLKRSGEQLRDLAASFNSKDTTPAVALKVAARRARSCVVLLSWRAVALRWQLGVPALVWHFFRCMLRFCVRFTRVS